MCPDIWKTQLHIAVLFMRHYCEAGGRLREKRMRMKGQRGCADIGVHHRLSVGLSARLEKGQHHVGIILQKLTLYSFNPFPLSGWTSLLIFNQVNGVWGSKQSLPVSHGLAGSERALTKCDFPSACLWLPNPILLSFQPLQVQAVS